MRLAETCFLMFAVISVAGWLLEVACKYIEYGRFINRGFLLGPWCPIYGVGALLAILLLEDCSGSPPTLFIMAMLVCGALEYATSWLMEKLFRARWWDYSARRFNINGRICLETLVIFGILCAVLIYAVKPILFGLFARIPDTALHIICALIAALFVADIAISGRTLRRIRACAEHTGGDDTERLTAAVRAELMKKGLIMRRYIKAFPYMRMYNSRILARINDAKKKLRADAEELRRQINQRYSEK